jgi:hypothetical protein
MEKLRRLTSPQIDQLTGYLDAAQHAFIKGQYDVSLEGTVFEITDATVTDEDVLTAAYEGFNPIEHRAECSVETMAARINDLLTLRREMWAADFRGIPSIVEERLREGYWSHVRACFDCDGARIVELGWNVPFVNIGLGFCFILYASDIRRCMLLVGNVSD